MVIKNENGKKVYDIIRKECDTGLGMSVVTYITSKGWDNVAGITEEQISTIEDNSFMTAELQQAIVRCAVRICKETDMMRDFIPYIIKYQYCGYAIAKEVSLHKYDFEEATWDNILTNLDVDPEETSYVKLSCVVLEEAITE